MGADNNPLKSSIGDQQARVQGGGAKGPAWAPPPLEIKKQKKEQI